MSTSSEPAVALSQLAYEQAANALTQQLQVLESLRGRAGTILSGAAISTSFLGGQALATGPLRTASWIAIGCFVAVGVTATAVVWPRLSIEMAVRAIKVESEREVDIRARPLASIFIALADHLHLSRRHNARHIARIATYLRAEVIFLTLEVVWWVVDLATRA